MSTVIVFVYPDEPDVLETVPTLKATLAELGLPEEVRVFAANRDPAARVLQVFGAVEL